MGNVGRKTNNVRVGTVLKQEGSSCKKKKAM